ncbi:putative 8-amino-7-oxononanoate synthase [Rosellinia necatrix]|uniref:Putative 8-amino-7-oxononanoate synthase n=1 Tax=Rosellinia necatrix TaxID=77044 RepID=A0A1S7UQX2_ROSNE|nr:putative 8-amino-7-oxononanoate synthase [Rosellinia necatrix]
MVPIVQHGSLESTLHRRLARRASQGRLRYLEIPRSNLVDFSSNDYLSLSQDSVIRNALISHLNNADEGLSAAPLNRRVIGSGGSRLLDGNSAFVEHLERKVSGFHGSEAALLFNSAYDANVGLISCVPEAEDIIVYDNLIHASIHDGMRLSRATQKIPFTHSSIVQPNAGQSVVQENDGIDTTASRGRPQSLEFTLKQLIHHNQRVRSGISNVFICVEALYSMDGDMAQLQYICDLVESLLPKGNGYIIVDEAHSIGLLGDRGQGLVSELALEDRVWARVVGFGKAMGCAGGAVLCSSIARLYLINYARTLIYTTAMSFPSLASISAAYDYMIIEPAEQRRQQLRTLIQRCHVQLRSLHERLRPATDILRLPGNASSSPIIPLFTKYSSSLAQHCQASGFMIRPIVAPTVPKGEERVRICLHAGNTIQQIDGLCQAIESWLNDIENRRGAKKDDRGSSNQTLVEMVKARL